MATGANDRYRIMVDDSYRFAQDEVIVKIVKRTMDGYIPIKITITEGELVPYNVATFPYNVATSVEDEQLSVAIPRELAELMLAAFARYFLSSEGDIVQTVQRQKRELERVTLQLEMLIAGIGRLGGK